GTLHNPRFRPLGVFSSCRRQRLQPIQCVLQVSLVVVTFVFSVNKAYRQIRLLSGRASLQGRQTKPTVVEPSFGSCRKAGNPLLFDDTLQRSIVGNTRFGNKIVV